MSDEHSSNPKPGSSSGISNSLVHLDLKALSEPVTKLIECVSKGVGTLYKPTAIVKEAKATAEANLILTQGEIDRERLMRAAHRVVFLEDRRQGVIESIITQAIGQLPEAVSQE